MKIVIASGVVDSLHAAAAAAHPNECCGLLLGRPGVIETIVTAPNISADPARSFEIDPATLLRTHREARAQNRQVIGHYHSHPDGSTLPSRRDAARATDNGQLWLIIANESIAGWQAVSDPDAIHGRFRPVTLAAA